MAGGVLDFQNLFSITSFFVHTSSLIWNSMTMTGMLYSITRSPSAVSRGTPFNSMTMTGMLYSITRSPSAVSRGTPFSSQWRWLGCFTASPEVPPQSAEERHFRNDQRPFNSIQSNQIKVVRPFQIRSVARYLSINSIQIKSRSFDLFKIGAWPATFQFNSIKSRSFDLFKLGAWPATFQFNSIKSNHDLL